MDDFLALGLALVVGVLLGAVFFGGLRWTVSKGLSSRHPAPWFLGSLVLRTGIVLSGFYFVSNGDWGRLLACLLGFTAARFIVLRLTGPTFECRNPSVKEAGLAP